MLELMKILGWTIQSPNQKVCTNCWLGNLVEKLVIVSLENVAIVTKIITQPSFQSVGIFLLVLEFIIY